VSTRSQGNSSNNDLPPELCTCIQWPNQNIIECQKPVIQVPIFNNYQNCSETPGDRFSRSLEGLELFSLPWGQNSPRCLHWHAARWIISIIQLTKGVFGVSFPPGTILSFKTGYRYKWISWISDKANAKSKLMMSFCEFSCAGDIFASRNRPSAQAAIPQVGCFLSLRVFFHGGCFD